jgi:hypothetical protein
MPPPLFGNDTMQAQHAHYLQLRPHDALPDLSHLSPFMAVVVIDDDSDEMWRWDVARWLVASGCRFMLAWGKECESWHEAVEEAGLEAFDYDDVEPEQRVLTTAHADEDLDEVLWFARHRASHPALRFANTVILHVAERGRPDALLAQFDEA